MGKGVLPNGPAAPSLENKFHGPALQRSIMHEAEPWGLRRGRASTSPQLPHGPPRIFMQVPLAFLRFRRPGKRRDPFYGKRDPAKMGLRRRVWKITFMGPLYEELMLEAEPWGWRRGRASTSPQLPHGPPRFFMQAPFAFLRFRRPGKWRDPFYGKRGPAKWACSAESGKSPSWARSTKN